MTDAEYSYEDHYDDENEDFTDGGFDYKEFIDEEEDDSDDLIIDDTKPLLPSTVAKALVAQRRKLRKARRDLKHLAAETAHTKWAFEDAKARAVLSSSGSNPDMRKAQAMTYQHFDKRTGAKRRVTHFGYDAEMADKLFRTQQQIVASLTKEIEAVRSIMATARDENPTSRRN